jgi:thiamine-monophosphate kinase
LGRWLAEERIATAMMDISDGLSTDLPRLCAASGVGARIKAAALPAVRPGERKHAQGGRLDAVKLEPLTWAVNGGDDYELLFTVPPSKANRLPRSVHGLQLTPIGEITRGRELLLRDADGHEQALTAAGWDPFGPFDKR